MTGVLRYQSIQNCSLHLQCFRCKVAFHSSVSLLTAKTEREREAKGKATGSLLENGDILISNNMVKKLIAKPKPVVLF